MDEDNHLPNNNAESDKTCAQLSREQAKCLMLEELTGLDLREEYDDEVVLDDLLSNWDAYRVGDRLIYNLQGDHDSSLSLDACSATVKIVPW